METSITLESLNLLTPHALESAYDVNKPTCEESLESIYEKEEQYMQLQYADIVILVYKINIVAFQKSGKKK